jgi:Protein of unknown function (DUF3617)
MNLSIIKISCAFGLFIISPFATAQKVMTPGSWEFVSESEVLNKSGQKGESQKKTMVCLSKATLAKDVYLDPKHEMANLTALGGKCAVFDFKRQGNAASWTLSCAMPRNIKVSQSYKNEVTATELISEVNQTLVNDPRFVEISTKIKGIYVGECAASGK